MRWEYRLEEFRELLLDEMTETLNALGAEGWEVITMTQHHRTLTALLKRPAN
jgi:hypothetical protein